MNLICYDWPKIVFEMHLYLSMVLVKGPYNMASSRPDNNVYLIESNGDETSVSSKRLWRTE
jgi:hypothetical protein